MSGIQEEECVYLDYNGTTPLHQRVREKMIPFLSYGFGNPSSSHAFGQLPKQALDNARRSVASLIDAKDPKEIIFTSGGTESINWAFKGICLPLARQPHNRKNRILVSAIEHVAVLNVCAYLELYGFETVTIPVDSRGFICLDILEKHLSDSEQSVENKVAIVCVMLANNEIGSIQPLEKVVNLCKRGNRNISVFCDASQAVGKMHVSVRELGVDFLALAGHKIYGPKGIGALYTRGDSEISKPENLFHGGGQEFGRRAGTENVLLAVGLGEACQWLLEEGDHFRTHIREQRDFLLAELSQRLCHDSFRVNSPVDEKGLGNTLSVSFKNIDSKSLLSSMSNELAVSSGAACHSSGESSASHVLVAIGVPEEFSRGTIRFSTGVSTTKASLERAVSILCKVLPDVYLL